MLAPPPGNSSGDSSRSGNATGASSRRREAEALEEPRVLGDGTLSNMEESREEASRGGERLIRRPDDFLPFISLRLRSAFGLDKRGLGIGNVGTG